MSILVDTNVLLRSIQAQHPQMATATRALNVLIGVNQDLRIAQQNVVEFWAVATRPVSKNGLGLSIEQAIVEVEIVRENFEMLPELPLDEEWQRLVTRYRVSGKSVHDARLVAAMLVHGVDRILTFNTQDFTRYAEIQPIDPAQVN